MFRKNNLLLVFGLILFLVSQSKGEIMTTILKNGITLIYEKDQRQPLLAIGIFSRYGSANEPEELAGITNIMQDMLLQGTKKHSAEEIATLIENAGGHLGVGSSYNFTSISLSIPKENFPKIKSLFTEILTEPLFPENQLPEEKNRQIAEITSRQDHLHSVAMDIMRENFYSDHPYGRLEIGTISGIKKITRQDLNNWYNLIYQPANLILVAVGDIDYETVRQLAEDLKFSKPIPTKNNFFPKDIPPLSNQLVENKVITVKSKFQQAYLIVNFVARPVTDQDFVRLKTIHLLLGSRMSARLFNELREKLSLAYEVNSFYPTQLVTSHFGIYLGLDSKNINLAENKINEILGDLQTNPPSEKELSEAKKYVRGLYLLDHQTVGRKMWYYDYWQVLKGEAAYDQKYLTEIEAVQPEEIRQTAKKYFSQPSLTVKIIPADEN